MTEWFLGIVAGIGAFLGVFILFAGDNQHVGIGGDWSWRVGDISAAWGYGLLIGVGLLLSAALVVVGVGRNRVSPAEAGDRDLAGLLWHAGIFLAVNTFIWIHDIAIGGGVNYAYWITIPWAVGLAIHTVTPVRPEQDQLDGVTDRGWRAPGSVPANTPTRPRTGGSS